MNKILIDNIIIIIIGCGGQLYPVLEPRWKWPSPTSDFIDMGCVKGCQAQTSYLKVKEYPRTITKGRNKVILRGEVKDARVDLTMSEDYSHLGNSIRGVW